VVIIMTSNIGSPQLVEGLDVDNQLSQVAREEVLAELRRHNRPPAMPLAVSESVRLRCFVEVLILSCGNPFARASSFYTQR
jgi:hypothetical protein